METKKEILMRLDIGRVKRYNYPLPKFSIQVLTTFQIKIYNQWCLGYKEITIGFISIKFHSPLQALTP